MGDTLNLDNDQRRNFDEWFQTDDISPQGFFRSIGMAAGTGKYRPKEELEPSFIDKFADHFGVLTDRAKEVKELSAKQQQLTPFMEKVLQAKVLRMANERYMPKTTGQVPDVMRSLGIEGGQGQPQPFPGSLGSPSASGTPQMNGLMPAPEMGLPPGASSVAAAAGPQISPLDNPAAQPLSDGGRFMTPDAMITAPLPTGAQPGVPGSPNPMNYGSGFDEQGRPVPLQPAPELPIQPIREEPMAMAQRKPMPAPPPADRPLRPDEMMTARLMLNAQASGQLVRDGKGGLIPFHPEAQLLDAGQQGELASIYGGNAPSGNVKLPAAPLMQALKGKQEGKAQEITAPVREYMKSHKLDPSIPEHVEMARQGVRGEKQSDEKAQIAYKEGLQSGSQELKGELKARYNVTNLIDATPDQVADAITAVTNRDISTAAQKQMNTFQLSGLGEEEKSKLGAFQQLARVSNRLRTEFTPAERRTFVGLLNNPISKTAQFLADNPKFAKFDALVNREGLAAFETGGKNLTVNESAIIFGFLPNAKEWSASNFETKLLEADDYARSRVHDIVNIATSTRRDIAQKMEKQLPAKDKKPSIMQRFKELEKQGLKGPDIYNQLAVEGYRED